MKSASLAFALIVLTVLPARADVTIGLAGPLTGPYATLGEQMKHGAAQAVEDINAAGGINGEKIVLRESDDACDPKQAVAVANQMIASGVRFVMGHACSGASIPASQVYAEEGTLMISPVSSNPELTSVGLTNVFRTCGRNDQEATAQSDYILKHLRDKKVAIIHDNNAVTRDIAERVKHDLNAAGVKEVLFDAYHPGDKDYSALVAKLMQKGVQALVIGGYHLEAGLITRQLRERGADIQVISDDALATKEFWAITGPAGEGVLISFLPDATKRPEAQPILARMRKTHEPEVYELYSYAAIEAIAEGIRRAGKDPVKVAAALRQTPVKTVLGPLAFDAKGDVVGAKYVMYRWHNGDYAEVE